MSDAVLRLCRKVFLLSIAVSPGLSGAESNLNPTVTLDTRLSATELIVGEPLELEVTLRWERPVDGTTLVTSVEFLDIAANKDGIRIEISPHVRDHEDYFSYLSAWERKAVLLTYQKPEWQKTYKLHSFLPLQQPGRYDIVARWQPEILQALAQTRMSEKHSDQRLVFLTEMRHETTATAVITCPKCEADRSFYLDVTGVACPDGKMVWPFYFQPPNNADDVLDAHPESTYAAHMLQNWVPDYTGWRYKTKPPKEFIQSAIADGPVKEFSPKWERVFRLVEINLRSGNTPQPLRSRFWMYYGERLLLRGHITKAKEAFEQAVKHSVREDSVYILRSKDFLEALADL